MAVSWPEMKDLKSLLTVQIHYGKCTTQQSGSRQSVKQTWLSINAANSFT